MTKAAHGGGSAASGTSRQGLRGLVLWLVGWAWLGSLLAAEPIEDGVVALDGFGSYVELPERLGEDWETATIEIRVCWDGTSYYGTPLQFGDDRSSLGFSQDETFSAPKVYAQKDSGRPHPVFLEQGIDLGVWLHLAATFEGARLRFWVNGTCLGTNALPAPGLTLLNNAPARWLGRSAWKENGYFVGRLDEVRLWNRILSDDELARLPRSRVTGTEPGLYARWSMETWTNEPSGRVCWSDGARRLPATLRGRARAMADETAVHARYDAPWWLEGTVRGPDGAPAIAELSWLEHDSRARHMVTDSEGRFRWRGVRKPNSDQLRVVAGNLGVLARMELRSGDRVQKDWVLDAVPSVEGQVLRWDGVARPGVRVRLRPSDPRAPQPPDGWMARTGPDGRFAFPALPDGEYDAECDSRRDPFAGATGSAVLRERFRVRRSEGPARVLFRVSTTGEDRVWRRFTRRDGLPDNTISTMGVDDLGTLWVGTPGGLARYDGARFTTWTRGDGVPGESVRALAFDREGGLWVAGEEGLARRTGDRFEPVPVISAAPELTVFDMACSGDGALWLATDQGVHRHQSGSWKAFGTGDGLPAFLVFSVWPDVGDSVRVLTQGGLWARLSDPGLEPHPADRWLSWGVDPLFCREIPTGTNSMSGDRWIWKRYNYPLYRGDGFLVAREDLDIPGSPDVRRILEVPGRETWVATQNQGLLRLGTDATRSLTAAQGLPSARVNVTLRARDGDLWIGTAAGLMRWRAAGPTLFREADGVPGTEVLDLLETPDGSIWVAGDRGVVRWAEGRLVAVPGVPGISFARLGSDLRGGVWAFAPGVGLFRGDGTGLLPAQVDVLQPHVWSADFRVLSSGELCFASVKGLVSLRDGKLEALHLPRRLFGEQILAILESGDGSLWFGSESQGLLRRDRHGQWSRFGRSDGLSSQRVHALHEDARGWLWVGTSDGVNLYRDGLWSRLDPRDGLAGEYVRHIRSESDGSVWFATDGGLTRYVPARSRPSAAWKGDPARDGEPGPADERLGNVGQRTDWSVETASENRLRWRVNQGDRVGEWSSLRSDPNWAWKPTNSGRVVMEAQVFDRDLNASETLRREVLVQAEWHRRPAVMVPASAAAVGVVGALAYLGTTLARQRRLSAQLRDEARQLAAADLARMEFERRLIRTQEAERGRIARELHDSLGQELLLIRHSALLARRSGAEKDPGPVLGEIADRASRSIEEVRSIAYALRPQELDRYGMAVAMRTLCDELGAGGDPGIEFHADPELPLLGQDVEIGLFRILQECLTNALKHARATRVRCSLRRQDAGVELQVTDDGCGFDPVTKVGTDAVGLGLNGMRERVRLLGGRSDLASQPGQGTTVTVWIPGTRGVEHDRPSLP